MSKTPFGELMKQRRVVFDGGMGTQLQALGLRGGEEPERWNIDRADAIRGVHEAYLRSGADVVTANTFGANAYRFPQDWEALLRAGVRIAKQAAGDSAYAALDAGSLGQLLKPNGDMDFEDAVRLFGDMAFAGLDEGCDLLLIETMTDLREIKAAVLGFTEAMRRASRTVPLLVSMSFDVQGRLLTGADVEGAIGLLRAMDGVSAIGLNCGQAPDKLLPNLRRALACAEGMPVFFMPNASLPVVVDGRTTFPTTPEEFAVGMRIAAELGARGLGGCCGTTPAYIELVAKIAREFSAKDSCDIARDAANNAGNARADASSDANASPTASACTADGLAPCILSGSSRTLIVGEKPIVIGERLNPTGKKRMKQALREGDMDYLLGEGVAQADAGADALDVNVGLPEIDEREMLPTVVEALQTVTGLPLQIDTADAAALEPALRRYIGRPLINSVCGKEESMQTVLPLARKYGAAVVCLLLDEQGIPETVEGRIAIARRILARAEQCGVAKRDLLFDALTLTVSTDPNAARLTLETVRRLHDELHVKTVLGVSNVSFGLPQRGLLTGSFIGMAIHSGLTAAIMNPMDANARAAFDCACAVLGYDDGFARYLDAHAGDGANGTNGAASSGGAASTSAAGGAASASASAGNASAQGFASVNGDAIKAALVAAQNAIGGAWTALTGEAAMSGTGIVSGGNGTSGANASVATNPSNMNSASTLNGIGAASGSASTSSASTNGASASANGAGASANGAGASANGASASANGTGASANGASASSTGSASPEAASQPQMNALFTAILKGLIGDAGRGAQALLDAKLDPIDVIEGGVMPALTEVGDRYEKGRFFLPQLLQSANAAQAAFDVIRAATPDHSEKDGFPVILATVKGDVHDIGKNIVKVLLQNYGFRVIDLGRDVAPEAVLAAVRESGATLVGLSALMTTTMPAMRDTIELLHAQAAGVRVVVGGAVLTEDYARQIGADAYGADAMATVRYAQAVEGQR